MARSRSTGPIAVVAAGALLLAACGSDDRASDSTGPITEATTGTTSGETSVEAVTEATTEEATEATAVEATVEAVTVVATTSIWADITANVACDGLADVQTIIAPGGDPHSFEPSLRDRETMDDADLVVANGLLLEESLADTIDAVESSGVPILRVGDQLDPIPTNAASHNDDAHSDDAHSDDDDHSDEDGDHDHDHDHGDADPHVWWDPTRIAAAAPLIADALAEVGVDRAALDACVARYVDELNALDGDIAALVAPLPADQRILVTNHDSLGYFADRYDFEVLGSVIPSSSSLAATSPAELDALAADIQATGVSAIFADTQNSSDDADALADRIGDVVVVSMLTDTLDEPGTDQGTYVGWLRQNVETIVEALGGAS
jgi:ABC-type Zn uptake system ZnuABC Zn-binding protein ZnuA